jgi:hypothetical protein
MSEKQTPATKVVTDKVRLSYAKVWTPEAVEEGGEKKYSVALIIPKSATALVARINKAIAAAKAEGMTKLFAGSKNVKLKMPLRDGDEERGDDPVYADSWFLNAVSKTKPQIVDKDLNPIIDQDDLYSGCYGRVSVNFYPFSVSGNKGIACGLGNIQKVADGERLAGGSSAEEDFGSLDAIDDEEEDLL